MWRQGPVSFVCGEHEPTRSCLRCVSHRKGPRERARCFDAEGSSSLQLYGRSDRHTEAHTADLPGAPWRKNQGTLSRPFLARGGPWQRVISWARWPAERKLRGDGGDVVLLDTTQSAKQTLPQEHIQARVVERILNDPVPYFKKVVVEVLQNFVSGALSRTWRGTDGVLL